MALSMATGLICIDGDTILSEEGTTEGAVPMTY